MITSVLVHTRENFPLLKDNITLSYNNSNDESHSDAMFINTSRQLKDCIGEFTMNSGSSPQTETQLSTVRLAIMNAHNNNGDIKTSSLYKHAITVFEGMMSYYKS